MCGHIQIWNISYSRWCKNRFCSSFTTTAMCSFILVWFFLEIFQFAGTLIVCRPTKTAGISRDKVSIFLMFLSLATTRFDYGQIFLWNWLMFCPSIGPRTTDTQWRNLKFWADVADKICFGRTYKFGSGSEFSAMQWRLFPLWASVVRDNKYEFPEQKSHGFGL